MPVAESRDMVVACERGLWGQCMLCSRYKLLSLSIMVDCIRLKREEA
jgi:hypothetical protein